MLNQDGEDDAWMNGVVERDAEVAAHDPAADEAEPALPPWPIRRVTTGMKRCSLPDAQRLIVVFNDLLADEPDPWAEADVDILAAIQEALDGQTPLFLVVQDDGLSPYYGRITVTGGQARLLLWEGAVPSATRRWRPPAPTRSWSPPARGRNGWSRPIRRGPISSPNRSVDIARATAELHDTVRASDPADCLAGTSVRREAATRVAGHPGRAPETVQTLAGLDVQVVFVPELVAAARAADADG
jgi:hypothetical protein